MKRPRKPRPSHKPPDHEFKDWERGRNPDRIAGRYLDGQSSAEEALGLLEHSDKRGLLYAARIATQAATESPSFNEASLLIDRSRTNYVKALDRMAGTAGFLNLKAEASIGLAQLPILGYMAMFKQMPPPKLLEQVYADTVNATFYAAQDITQRNTTTEVEMSKLIGTVTEAAVVTLGQRYAIRNIADGSWLPVHSLYVEDAKAVLGSATSLAWDMTLFEDLGDGPKAVDRMQIKSSNRRQIGNPTMAYADGITLLHFNPDLALPSDTGLSQVHTVRQAATELAGQQSASAHLDARTELLLDIIG